MLASCTDRFDLWVHDNCPDSDTVRTRVSLSLEISSGKPKNNEWFC